MVEPLGRREDRREELRAVASSSARSAREAPAEVEIAISGVRRSWLTARSTAVLIASATPQRFGLERLRARAARDRSRPEQRRESRQDAGRAPLPRAALEAIVPSRAGRSGQLEPAGAALSPSSIAARSALQRPRGLGRDLVELGDTVPRSRSEVAISARSAASARRRDRAARSRHDDGRDEEDGEREPVARVGERERVDRGEEEAVEGEHARDRHGIA